MVPRYQTVLVIHQSLRDELHGRFFFGFYTGGIYERTNKKIEWETCLTGTPEACRQIALISRQAENIKDYSSGWRKKLDTLVERTNDVRGRCHAHHIIVGENRYEDSQAACALPCVALMLLIARDRLKVTINGQVYNPDNNQHR